MKKIAVIIAVLLSLSILAACGTQNQPSGDQSPNAPGNQTNAPKSVKIGVMCPTTGPLAGLGEGSPYWEEWFRDYINDELGGIYFKDYDATLPVEMVFYDTASSEENAAELTRKLITEDKVDIIICRHTPNTVVACTAITEQYEVPTIAVDCPGTTWLGQGDHHWSFLSSPLVPTYYQAYSSIWKQAGYTTDNPKSKIGIVFANDLDGTILGPAYSAEAEKDGFELYDPGRYAAGTNDFASLIAQYQQNNIEIIWGVMNTAEFGAFWAQCQQLGYKPKIVVIGKAYMLESQVLAIGADLMDGMGNEVWWDTRFPFKSEIMGITCTEYGEMYYKAIGKKAAGPQGAKFVSWEIMIDVLQRAPNLEPETLRSTIAATDLNTLMGRIKYGDNNHCPTIACGGQWVMTPDGGVMQEIVGNPDPSNGIQLTAPVKTSGRAWD